MKVAHASVTVAPIRFFEDGSGAPTTVTVGGYKYACDYLNGARVQLISESPGTRVGCKIAASRAKSAYIQAVYAGASSDWFRANTAMYA